MSFTKGRPGPTLSGPLFAATGLAMVLLPACSGDEEGDGCSAPSAAPDAEIALLPEGMSFDEVGTVTEVESKDGELTVRAVSTEPLDELTVLIQDAVTAAGYDPSGMDNEGHEAEVFFNLGTLAAGQAAIEEAGCEGQWDIDLVLVEPDAVPPSGSTTE
jgi:hypothetical protein